MPRSLLDLPPKARLPFSLAYVVVLVAMVAAGQLAPDHVFGFQMFNESSSLRIRLFREVGPARSPRLVPMVNGAWRARDARGNRHLFDWHDRVPTGSISHVDRFVHASYGLGAQLFHLERALDDVARHVPLDAETHAFVAVVDTLKNGRDPRTVRFRAARK